MKTTPKQNPLRAGEANRMPQTPVAISGIWLRREGNFAVMLIERDGRWFEIVREPLDSQFSHIIEPNGIRRIAP
jgi:hypothetical protein